MENGFSILSEIYDTIGNKVIENRCDLNFGKIVLSSTGNCLYIFKNGEENGLKIFLRYDHNSNNFKLYQRTFDINDPNFIEVIALEMINCYCRLEKMELKY